MTKKNSLPMAEKRELAESTIELREEGQGTRTITGYAVKWDMRSHPLGYYTRFREVFKRGAFTETLQNDDVRALWSHDTSKVLGRTKNGTLRLHEDDIGLRFELDLPNNTQGNDAYESIKRGDVDGVSFGFQAREEEWDEADPKNVLRSIHKAGLLEISPVGFPAYPDSQVDARGADPYKVYKEEQQQIEEKELRQKLILQTYL